MLIYGFVICFFVLRRFINQNQLFEREFTDMSSGERLPATFFMVFLYVSRVHEWPVFLAFLCGVMGIAVTVFIGYHLKLVRNGTTTNESAKIDWLVRRYKHPSIPPEFKARLQNSLINVHDVYRPSSMLEALKLVFFA